MSMATSTNTQSPALHVADSHDLIRVQGARERPDNITQCAVPIAIHPSAQKWNSANFALTDFSDVHLTRGVARAFIRVG
jgi:hypothetical protein